ncbi:MAG TPA: hypothetical protein P5064_07435 [Clostridia bacterium]|jgi:hypothetical protein|nr:hypothetical protein [Clostridiaceae bacterium]HOF26071.1 hypothetical protein [Clostridia bacterium]HOM34624.1 hypothetical protein [Clostridia bacterium]HOR89248.1 hypothetical protein [Clostridia bacterium]HOT71368.1 hypothetical protein [Clostridia bacterium]
MKLKALKIILIILFLLSGTATFLFSPYYELKNITVEESAVNITDTLGECGVVAGCNINLLLLSKGNILSGHLVKAEEQVMSDVNIKNLSIKRSGRNDITVSCQSRKPVMCISHDDYVIYFDYDGTIIDTSQMKAEKAILIRGLDLDFFYPGRNILTCNYMLEDISVLCSEIEKYDTANYTAIRTLINEIEMQENNRIIVKYDNRLDILMDMTDDVKYNANVLCAILSNMNQNSKGTVDFTVSDTPFFSPASE